MNPRVYREFERICSERNAGGRILEIGAVPSSGSLLSMKSLCHATEKIGVNLEGPFEYEDFRIVKGNANCMEFFEDGRFDTVLCNAVLEHDKFFWKTLAEIRRVTRSGGLVVIGTPGFTQLGKGRRVRSLLGKTPFVSRYVSSLMKSTLTFHIHNEPGDYYRFSPQAYKEVLFEGMKDVQVCTIMLPPRVIGSGVKP